MGSPHYQMAGSDELEALGEDDGAVAYDTSAGLGPDDPVRLTSGVDDQAPPKRGRCVLIVFAVLAAIGLVVFLGVFFSVRARDKESDSKEAPSSSASPKVPSSPSSPKVPSSPSSPKAPSSPSSPKAPSSPSSPKAPTTSSGSPITPPTPPATVPNSPPVSAPNVDVNTYTVKVLESLPHDPLAFTQGFEYANGVFYEGTGIRGRSSLRKVDVKTGKVLQNYKYTDTTLFGEGITLHRDSHIFMLMWQAGRGYVFNQSTFEVIKEWRYKGEGWGLAMDRENEEVYMSDGTSVLRVLDPDSLAEKRYVNVTLRGKPVRNLNELEWICGEVWANVWQTSKIYRIDPRSGVITSIIDASNLPLSSDFSPSMDVLNGIAFDRETGRLWFTGKLWSVVYRVSIPDTSLDLNNCK